MNFLLFLIIVAFTNVSFTQSFQMQYSKTSVNEVHITTVYKGPSAEIILPSRGRIVALSEQNDLNAGGGKIRVGIRVGSEDTSSKEYTVRFTYALLVPNQGGIGSITSNWYPTIKNQEEIQYHISSPSDQNMFVYPYQSVETNTYVFKANQDTKLAMFANTKSVSDTELPITLFAATQFKTSFENIIKIYNYISEYFGKQDINNIIIVNAPFVTSHGFISEDALILSISGIGTEEQIRDAMINAWSTHKENLSTRLFNMFKDTVFRLAKLNLDEAPTTVDTTQNNTETQSNEQSTSENTNKLTIEQDPSKIVLVPNTSYYEELFSKGFISNEVVVANIEGIVNNYALLHLAQYNIGADNLLAGIKAYFNQGNTQNTNVAITKTNLQSTTNTETTTTTNTNETDIQDKKDTEYVDWNIITQNKLQDPLYTLYTEEVLVDKGIVPHLSAKGQNVTRNSYNIPNFNLIDSDGQEVDVNWNEFRTIVINISSNSTYTLDPDRLVPQTSYIDSFYTFNTNEQIIRHKIINIADRNKAPGEINIQKHLDIVKFNAPSGNTFDIPDSHNIYVVISRILSNTKGTLKPAIKESFISVDPDGKIAYITSRLRI